MQKGDLTQKWVFIEGQTRPKRHGILKDQFGLKLERKTGEEKEEEKEEKRKKGDSSQDQAKKVWNSDFWYGCLDFDMELWFCMDFLSRYKFVGYGL